MNDKLKIEAALERSLRRQVVVPKLDHKFDNAVWARIDAQESRSASKLPTPVGAIPKTPRWLFLGNILGLGAVAVFLITFGAQMLAGSNLEVYLSRNPGALTESFLMNASSVVAIAAVAVGLMFTPLGRRLREELG